MLRIDGALLPVAGQSIWDRDRVAPALDSILTHEQRETFDERLELDFAFTLSANARFRVNFYQQRGAIGGAFRLIPTEIKPLEALGVPEVVGAVRQAAARPRARHRPHRFGQVDDARRAHRPGQPHARPTTS